MYDDIKFSLSVVVAMFATAFSLLAQDTRLCLTDESTYPSGYLQINSISDLLDDYDQNNSTLLPILIPCEAYQSFDGGYIVVNLDGKESRFSDKFVQLLSESGLEEKSTGIISYPVIVSLNPKTHDYELTNFEDAPLAYIAREPEYDPLWFSRYHFERYSKSGTHTMT